MSTPVTLGCKKGWESNVWYFPHIHFPISEIGTHGIIHIIDYIHICNGIFWGHPRLRCPTFYLVHKGLKLPSVSGEGQVTPRRGNRRAYVDHHASPFAGLVRFSPV